MNSASDISREEHEQALAALQSQLVALRIRNAELELQNAWFRRQLFGQRSEKQLLPVEARQLSLGETLQESLPQESETVRAYQRRMAKEQPERGEDEALLRFDDTVPIQTIELLPDEVKGLTEDAYEVVSEKVTHRLAQRPGAYVVLKYVRKVVKLKTERSLVSAPAPDSVFDRSFADVSLIAAVLVDKFLYHLPLYRQHQRLAASGIDISRVTLTNYVHRAVALLSPIYYAQLSSILESEVLLMDETPIKAGRVLPGKMKQGYYWPLLGDKQEVAFPFAASRAEKMAREVLGSYCGTLVTDGYSVYERVAEANEALRHAQCWVHTRRQFIKAEELEPARAKKAIALIGELYAIEQKFKDASAEERLTARQERSRLVVDELFTWLRSELTNTVLLPSNAFTKAAAYALERERALRVFLDDAAVPLDTNALERALRPIPMGRKAWLFCWTEVGAHYVGHIQSLLVTCKLHGVHTYDYLVDVLQRISTHRACDVHLLTPRLWKNEFAAQPLRSDLSTERNYVGR